MALTRYGDARTKVLFLWPITWNYASMGSYEMVPQETC